jgi:kynurenine formamidase
MPWRSYSELIRRDDGPPGSSWGEFGTSDEKGSVNFMTPAGVANATKLVKRGDVFGLDYELGAFDPAPVPERYPPKHVIFGTHDDQRDDYLDRFYLQGSSQIDGLRHRRHSQHGFYNGVDSNRVRVGTRDLGINRWADHGIVGRGVLIDVQRYLIGNGSRLDHESGQPFSTELMNAAASSQGIHFIPGDILLIRTGWAGYFLNQLSSGIDPDYVRGVTASPGLIQSHETLAWLWDHRFTLVAADNVALEAMPVVDSSPFHSDTDGGMMHQQLIALLGLAIGELWRLDQLAEDCAHDGVYEFMVVSKPLNLVGGVGSPANAIAIK